MNTKILLVYFSQSGQAKEVADSFCKNLNDTEITFHQIEPTQTFPYPWSVFSFFNAFPETFTQQPISLKKPDHPLSTEHDLVVLVYQPWFLTPSLPIASFLQSDEAKILLKDKAVVTISCSRNMWLGAQEKVKVHLKTLEAKLVGNIALVDTAPNLQSVVTILRWMLTGKRNPFWFFPKAGIQDADIARAAIYGPIVENAIKTNEQSSLQNILNENGAVTINPSLLLLEKRGQKAFKIWAKFIGNADPQSLQRKIRVGLFSFLLPTVVFILSPLLTILSIVLQTINKSSLDSIAVKFQQNESVDFF